MERDRERLRVNKRNREKLPDIGKDWEKLIETSETKRN